VDFVAAPNSSKTTELASQIARMGKHLFFGIGSLTYTLVHEMSHVLMAKKFTGQNGKIKIFLDSAQETFSGVSNEEKILKAKTRFQRTAVTAAGPIGSIAFSAAQLALQTALGKKLFMPVDFVLGFGAICNILRELQYAISSALAKDTGDFGRIRKRGITHLIVASGALAVVSLAAAYISKRWYTAFLDKISDPVQPTPKQQMKASFQKTLPSRKR